MRHVSYLMVAALLSSATAPLAAQGMPIQVGRRAMLGLDLSDGEPISYFLEHSDQLELTDPQRMALINVRRRLRAANAPYMQQLDSLRELLGISLQPKPRLDSSDEAALERFRKLSQPIVEMIRANNQTAQAEARTLLAEPQRTKLDSMVVVDRDSTRLGGRRGGRPPRL